MKIGDLLYKAVQSHVSEYGIYADLIEHLEDRLDEMKKNDKPVKECSILDGFALALAVAKMYASNETEVQGR